MIRFHHHYTVEEARALLPQIRTWLTRLDFLQAQLQSADRAIDSILASGADAGGTTVNDRVRLELERTHVMEEFANRSLILRDHERGKVDFPSIREGRGVFLCWERSESSVEYWRELDGDDDGRVSV